MIQALLGVLTHADGVSSATPDWLSYVLAWGPGGIVLGMVLLGILEPKRVRQSLEIDRDSWKNAFNTEREAHQVTRDALAAANARAEAAVESAQTMTRMLEALGHPRRVGSGSG